jgi:hypothetical protein
MATRTLRFDQPVPVALPPSGDVVLAIRFYRDRIPFQFLPFTRIGIGSLDSIRTATGLDRLRDFNNGPLSRYAALSLSC